MTSDTNPKDANKWITGELFRLFNEENQEFDDKRINPHDLSKNSKCFKCPDGTQPKAPPYPGDSESRQNICQPCPYPTVGEGGFCNHNCLMPGDPDVQLQFL